MPRFTYKAKKGPTEIVQGEVDADNEDAALGEIARQGLIPVKLEPVSSETKSHLKNSSSPSSPQKKAEKKEKDEEKLLPRDAGRVTVKHRDFNIFTRQFAILLKANVPLLRIYGVLQTQTENRKFKAVLAEIQEKIRKGSALSDALKGYPRIFSQLYVSMVESGEISGTLDVVLMRLAEFSEKEAELRGKVQSALVYPLFLMTVGVLTVFVLLTFILPRLMGVFADLGTELPQITKFIIKVSELCQHYWMYMTAGAALVVVLLRMRGISQAQKKVFDRVVLKVPVFGNLVRKSETARFLRSLELLYENGISLYKAVEVATRTVGNRVIQEKLEKVPDLLRSGSTLTKSLEEVPYLSDFVTNMVSVGEESGKLGESLRETASFYDRESEQMVKLATTLIEPMMILIVGGVIGFIIIGMLLPIFEIQALAQ